VASTELVSNAGQDSPVLMFTIGSVIGAGRLTEICAELLSENGEAVIEAKITDGFSFGPMEKDARFQVVKALTRTAVDASNTIRDELSDRFVLRRPWVGKGLRVKAAKKSSMESDVSHRDSFMTKQEEGGTERPYGRHFGIPAGIRKNERANIPRSRRPRSILDRSNVFKGDPHGRGEGIFQRMGNRKLMLLYLLVEKRTTAPIWHFEDTTVEVVEERFNEHFEFGN
jgi:hypothetical protein